MGMPSFRVQRRRPTTDQCPSSKVFGTSENPLVRKAALEGPTPRGKSSASTSASPSELSRAHAATTSSACSSSRRARVRAASPPVARNLHRSATRPTVCTTARSASRRTTPSPHGDASTALTFELHFERKSRHSRGATPSQSSSSRRAEGQIVASRVPYLRANIKQELKIESASRRTSEMKIK